MNIDELPEKLRRRIEVVAESGCWVWRGSDRRGYGNVWWKGSNRPVHRVVWSLSGKTLPELPYVLDHLCRVRRCANPAHLRVLTNKMNILIGTGVAAVNSRKEQCLNGHPFSDENTSISPDAKRRCLSCHREWKRRWRARVKIAQVTENAS